MGVTLLGLGPGAPGLLSREAWDLLQSVPELYLRTSRHPAVDSFPERLQLHSFDELYERASGYEEVYAGIIERVIELGRRPQGVVYAVPGHPFVAEATCPAIARQAEGAGLAVRVVEGISFIEPALTLLRIDPFPQLSLVDALELASGHYPSFPPDWPALIAQIHSRAVASEVKLTLMGAYPDDHPVQLVHAAGTPAGQVESLPLHAIDKRDSIGWLTCLYVPALETGISFETFQELVAHLRAPEGCPWDREQTHRSLRPNLLEETYEVLEAIDGGAQEALKEELGDLMLQIVLHVQIASESGDFRMPEVLRSIHEKLVRRHPHVFGEEDVADVDRVLHNWEQLKAAEREARGDGEVGALAGVAQALPALAQAFSYQRRAARLGFDWPDVVGVYEKVREELAEVAEAPDEEAREGEVGDLLFAVVNLARWYDLDPEGVLREANARFRRRFHALERAAQDQGRSFSDLSLEEMDALWEASKRES